MSDLVFLASVEVCRDLTAEELSRLTACCRPDSRLAEELIGREGDEANDLFFLKEGEIELRFEMPGRETGPEMAISRVKPGDTFGWSALVPPHRYTLSSYCASTRCAFYRLDRQELLRLFDDHPRIGYIFMRNLTLVIAKRFLALQDDLARMHGYDLLEQRPREIW